MGGSACDYAGVQPSHDDLHRAWSAAIECEGLGGARSETLQTLIRLRDRKTTWFGSEENNLRVSLDNYIRAKTTP